MYRQKSVVLQGVVDITNDRCFEFEDQPILPVDMLVFLLCYGIIRLSIYVIRIQLYLLVLFGYPAMLLAIV